MKSKKRSRRRRRTPIRVPARQELAAPPGIVQSAAEARGARVSVVAYGYDALTETELDDLARLDALRSAGGVCWVNVEGVGDADRLNGLAQKFGWHPLVLEDVLSVHQRPKTEEYDDYVYVVVLMPSGEEGLPFEQLSLLFGKDYVVTVHGEGQREPLEAVRDRIRAARGRIRSSAGDYLAYAIIDAVIDHYFPVVEKLNDRLETLEAYLGAPQDDAAFSDVHTIRNDLHTAWRVVSATGEAVSRLVREETLAVTKSTKLYLRDCQDHCSQLLDAVGACRELSASLMELHQIDVSNRTNEGMRLLTMIATIFIPMEFIAAVYGMNFDRNASPFNMPELGWPFGYLVSLGMMLLVGLAFISYFRRRGWLGGGVHHVNSTGA